MTTTESNNNSTKYVIELY